MRTDHLTGSARTGPTPRSPATSTRRSTTSWSPFPAGRVSTYGARSGGSSGWDPAGRPCPVPGRCRRAVAPRRAGRRHRGRTGARPPAGAAGRGGRAGPPAAGRPRRGALARRLTTGAGPVGPRGHMAGMSAAGPRAGGTAGRTTGSSCRRAPAGAPGPRRGPAGRGRPPRRSPLVLAGPGRQDHHRRRGRRGPHRGRARPRAGPRPDLQPQGAGRAARPDHRAGRPHRPRPVARTFHSYAFGVLHRAAALRGDPPPGCSPRPSRTSR